MNTTPALPVPPVVIAECDEGFHHPPGDLSHCVQDAVPPPTAQPIPSLGAWGLIGLVLMIFVAAGVRIIRGER